MLHLINPGFFLDFIFFPYEFPKINNQKILFLIGKRLSSRRKLLVLLLYEALECLILGNCLGEFLQEEIGRLIHLKNIFQNLSHRHLILKLNKLLAIEKCENL